MAGESVMIEHDETLASLTTSRPPAARVLRRHGIDFGQSGRRRLSDACREKNLDPDWLLRQIEAEEARQRVSFRGICWATLPTDLIIDYIVQRYHLRLPSELERIEVLARSRLGERGRECAESSTVFDALFALKNELSAHVRETQDLIVPRIIDKRPLENLASVALEQHAVIETALERVQQVCHEQAIGSDDELPRALAAFEAELREYLRLERSELFPAALGLEHNGSIV